MGHHGRLFQQEGKSDSRRYSARNKLNLLSGDGHRYQNFVASISRSRDSGLFFLRTETCTVYVYISRYCAKETMFKLLRETLQKALADGTVSVYANYRPCPPHADTFTPKNMQELMDVASENFEILLKIDKLVLESRAIVYV